MKITNFSYFFNNVIMLLCIVFFAFATVQCASDDSNDNNGNGNNDIDKDNDGLIEISTLNQLYNMRYNLAGTSYKTSSNGTENTAGAPTANNKANVVKMQLALVVMN